MLVVENKIRNDLKRNYNMNIDILFLYKFFVFYLLFDCYFRMLSLYGWIYGKNGIIFVYDVISLVIWNIERGGKVIFIVGWDWRINL